MLNTSVKKITFLENSPYCFIARSVKICIVDDDPNVLETYSNILNRYPLYSVATFSSATEANDAFSTGRCIHVCIMDLGLTDLNNDEFYLIKKFSTKSSFVVLTAKDSIHAGFECGKQGSFSVFKKPINFEKIDFINTINDAFFYSLINTEKDKHCKPIISAIIKALRTCSPTNINEWAYNACITEQYLRRVWNTVFGYQPKYFLWFYKMMTSAFDFCNKEFLEMSGIFGPDSCSCGQMANNSIMPITNHFHTQKKIFETVMSIAT